MSLPRCLTLAMIFSLLLFVFIELEAVIVKNLESSESSLASAFQTVKEMRFKANLDFQIQRWLSMFRENLSLQTDEILRQGKEPDYLVENLPPHSLTVVKASKSGKVLKTYNLAGKMDDQLLRTFIDLVGEFKIEFSDISLGPEKKEDLKRCDLMMRKLLNVETAKVNMIMLRASRFSIYNSENRLTWFFWDRFFNVRGENLFIFSKLDLTDVSNNYKFRSFLKSYQNEKIQCAYYDYFNQRFICSSAFRKKVALKDLQTISRECQKIAVEAKDQKRHEVIVLPFHRHTAVIGRIIEHAGLFPVAIISDDFQNDKSHLTTKLSAFILFNCLVLFLVNAVVFGRGPKMKVGTVLIMAMFFAIFMPFMLGRTVFKLILRESYEKERLKVERNLHQSLSGVDNSCKTAQQNLKERLAGILNKPEMLKRIRQEEVNHSDKDLENSFAKDVIVQLFAEVAKGYEFLPLKYRIPNAFILSGPNDFLRYYNRYRGFKIYSRNTFDEAESMFLILSLMKQRFFNYHAASSFAQGFSGRQKPGKILDRNLILMEGIRERLKSSLGPEKFHEIMHKKAEIAGFRSSFGEAFISTFALPYEGKLRYFAGCFWDEFTNCSTFLRRAFAYRREADIEEIQKTSGSFLQKLDPVALIRRKPIVLMAFDGFRFDSFSSEDNEPGVLSNLVKNTYRSKLLLRHETTGENASIFEVFPPSNITVYMLGAQQDITHLHRIEKVRSILFLCGTAFFFLFAFAAAKNLSGSFTNPLQHLLWGLRMVEKNDYSVRLKDSREDEFGSISRAFNLMTRRLKEKDTLGRFVPDSVKKLAASPDLLQKALEGEEEDVTIVFSNLEGFVRLALDGTEKDVQAYLEFSLGRYFARVAEHGGEIDKVIGEKILIIFSHRKMGKERAVAAAISLARDIIADFSDEKDLKPVFGVNMGRVISGIIGAANVRMDLTVIGDPVNVAARLCSLARSDVQPIVISGLVNEVAAREFETEKVDIDKVRGKRQEVEVYRLRL